MLIIQEFIMKRKSLFFLALISLLFFWTCKGQPGDVYFAFDWYSGYLESIYSSDTNIPNTVTDETYYMTEPGTYRAEWKYTSDTTGYYLYYNIRADEGTLFLDGADNFFLLELYYDGYYSYTYTQRALADNSELLKEFIETSSEMKDKSAESGESMIIAGPFDTEGMEQVDLFSYTETKGGYTLTATYGVYVPLE